MNLGPNVVSLKVTSRARRWYVFWAYMALNNVRVVHSVEQALAAASKGVEIILMGNLNVKLLEAQDERKEELVVALANYGL